ncbi:MAG: response regulator [Oscillatoriales cyanobacterium]|uniref:SpoIIE family protein phosphatase n=4 Tax=Microcoleus TaxID=44471 RepID=A0ABU8YTH1_9CYAN|nr:MAG: response regulator [Oscillatoriales cyanobacterium]TAD95278.1 MAG: response regulator [Oscillatoriales cyanobacterium]TAF04916.1 MAG: response regulator [Oscillatoriales cyanobacterium]TAF39776.1 MAG: response regulator [Oscillatoriales cyanobacterium]TAF64912.1 MAG: response regulator [Oscillatoriales cyanobacterium]
MSRGDGSKLKLMVVDDEPDNLDLLYRTFRRDFQVYKADSALTALEVLDAQGEMAVIISDQRMPEMNGTEFLGKTVERFPDTIRILLTGYTDVEDLVEAINSGQVFKYITKPWNPEELKLVINQASETYKYYKQRSVELRRALRKESLFNEVMSVIRGSLDYSSMVQTIVQTVGQTFEANYCMLRPVEGDRLLPSTFPYQSQTAEPNIFSFDENLLVQAVASRQTQLHQTSQNPGNSVQMAVPLTYQQEILAVLALYQQGGTNPWSSEDIELIEGVAAQAALALSQAKLYQRTLDLAKQMQNELEVARQIQTNLLRQSWPDFETVRVQACCYPAREVGGDFFEVYVHSQGDIWIAVGDVSGKGVPAALFMASAISVMRRELSQEISPEPSQVMTNMNSSMADDLIGNNHFITMVVARYTPSTGHLAFANAGHIYPIVWSHSEVKAQAASGSTPVEPNFLKARGIPLGILPVWKGKGGTIELKSGDVFLLTSDGITEATVMTEAVPGGEQTRSMLQQEGLWELLIQEPGSFNLDNLLAYIRADNPVQEDDQTILSLEVL